jgi:hypothetical protein
MDSVPQLLDQVFLIASRVVFADHCGCAEVLLPKVRDVEEVAGLISQQELPRGDLDPLAQHHQPIGALALASDALPRH